jgi:hypothetical protein
MAQAQAAHSHAVVSGFVENLQEPRTPYISPSGLSKKLGVKVANLAELTGVHRNTPHNPSSERLQGRMREMIKATSAATESTGDLAKAIYWYRNEPIADYGHRTAAELVADGEIEAVLAYIRDLENGARG